MAKALTENASWRIIFPIATSVLILAHFQLPENLFAPRKIRSGVGEPQSVLVCREHSHPAKMPFAARLRKAYLSGMDAETFESYHGENARKKILSLLDANHNSILTHGEKQKARIILFAHGWGGSEAISVARDLEKDGIQVLLTIQVDSLSKIHQNDEVIPANVAQAANFYQPDGFVHGESAIHAADPARMKIILSGDRAGTREESSRQSIRLCTSEQTGAFASPRIVVELRQMSGEGKWEPARRA